MERPPPSEAVVDGARHEIGASIEPALALHEVEEEHAGELQQGKCAAIGCRGSRRHGVAKLLEGMAELTKEAGAERFDGEQFGETRCRLERCEVPKHRDAFECRHRGRVGLVERELQHRRAIECNGEDEPAARGIEAHNARGATQCGTGPGNGPGGGPSPPGRTG